MEEKAAVFDTTTSNDRFWEDCGYDVMLPRLSVGQFIMDEETGMGINTKDKLRVRYDPDFKWIFGGGDTFFDGSGTKEG